MKKSYQRPESVVVRIDMVSMNAESPNIHVNNNPNASVNAGDVESREYDEWDDEW